MIGALLAVSRAESRTAAGWNERWKGRRHREELLPGVIPLGLPHVGMSCWPADLAAVPPPLKGGGGGGGGVFVEVGVGAKATLGLAGRGDGHDVPLAERCRAARQEGTATGPGPFSAADVGCCLSGTPVPLPTEPVLPLALRAVLPPLSGIVLPRARAERGGPHLPPSRILSWGYPIAPPDGAEAAEAEGGRSGPRPALLLRCPVGDAGGRGGRPPPPLTPRTGALTEGLLRRGCLEEALALGEETAAARACSMLARAS